MGDEDRSAANIRTIEAEVNQLRQAMARKQDKASKQREDLLQSLRCQITDLQHEVALAQDEVKVRDKDLAACQLVVARLKAGEVQRLADISDLKAKLSVASEQGQSQRASLEQAQKDLKIARDDQRSACIRAENSEKLQNEDIQRRESQFFQLIADKDACWAPDRRPARTPKRGNWATQSGYSAGGRRKNAVFAPSIRAPNPQIRAFSHKTCLRSLFPPH